MDAGIYNIWNQKTGRVYIGGSVHVNTRLDEHKRDLHYGRHSNRMLQADFTTQKGREFVFEVLTRFDNSDQAYRQERALFNRLKTEGVPLYNLRFQGHPSVKAAIHPDARKLTSLGVAIEQETYDLIRECVDARQEWKATGRGSMSEWVREAIREKLERDLGR
jgi:group I intron endonuclease